MDEVSMIKRVSTSLAAVTALTVAVAAHASPLATVDQQNGVATNDFYSGQFRIGQSFVPSLSAIDAIEFDLSTLTGGNSVYVNLRDGLSGTGGLDGPILGTSNTIVIPLEAPFERRHFDFPSRIPLVPGNVYVAELVSTNGFAGRLTLNSSYAAGVALPPTSFEAEWDLVFVEGLHVPEPSTAAAALTALLLCASLGSRRRRAD
jgi:hypothetical protein